MKHEQTLFCRDNVLVFLVYLFAKVNKSYLQTTRTEKLDLRLSRQAREVLRSAAIAAHRSMSEIAGIDVQLLRH